MCSTCDISKPRAYAHKWEVPLVRLAALITVAALLLAVGALVAFDEKTLEENSWLLSGPLVLGTLPVIYIGRYFLAAKHRATAAKAGPDQFPELWAIYSELLERYGLPYAPDLYVQNGNGEVNAFAFSCSRVGNFIVINSEISVLAKDQPHVVRFVLAHELAHHKLGHVNFRRLAVSLIMDMLYLPGKALSRAQEYSADRLALAICPETANSLLLLAVGPHLTREVSPDAMLRQAEDEEKSLMIRVVNSLQTHPVFTKRFMALKQIEESGFGNHGSLF
jgi:Zn-dependent protease with chaperone function